MLGVRTIPESFAPPVWREAGENMASSGSFKAKHTLVEDHLRRMIHAGQVTEGQRLPDDEELARQFECSRGTVRKAVQSLGADGLVKSRQGVGTFVREKRRQKFIGVIVPNLTSPEHGHMVKALTTQAARRGYSVLLSVVEEGHGPAEREGIEREFIEKMGRLHVAGVAKSPTTIELEAEFRARLHALGAPLVIVNDFWCDCHDAHHVALDEWAATRMAVEYLASLGHKRIGFFTRRGGNERPYAAEGFLAAMQAHGLPHDEGRVFGMEWEAMARRVSAGEDGADLTALIVPYYYSAGSLSEALRAVGVGVPRDVSVMSLGDVLDEQHRRWDLTSTLMPSDAMAKQTLDILLTKAGEGDASFFSRYLFQPTLHVGSTTAPPREVPRKRRKRPALVAATGALSTI